MAYRALYREWRPNVFADVIGQKAVVKTLLRQITTGRIAHAYLFCGSKGTGKTTLAKIMSRAVNCLNPSEGEPCGVCEVCKAILSESTLDVIELDAASNNSVDNVRDLLEQVRYPAQLGKYKVYIIDEVHMLSTAAFNALLKTLEEPPEHVVFILATTEPQRIPATILSRVQRFDISRIPAVLIQERMEQALERLQITVEPEALRMIARAAEGAMRDAWSILDMAVSAAVGDHITAEIVRDILGAADKDFLFGFADALAARDTRAVMEKIDQLIRAGYEAQVFLRELTRHLRALLIVKVVSTDASALLQSTEEDEKRYREQTEKFSQARLIRMMNGLMTADSELRYAASQRIGLEIAALRACQDAEGESNAALAERVAELEIKLNELPTTTTQQQSAILPLENMQETMKQTVKPETTTVKSVEPSQEVNLEQSTSSSETADQPKYNDADIWKAALKQLAAGEPAIFGLLKREHFLGEHGGVFRVRVAQSRAGFSYANLRKPEKVEAIVKTLTAAAGRPVGFEAILEGNDEPKADVRESIQMLAEAVGRDLLQIDDTED
ncbi:MAG TPA: DNA polymerase III subunit gamma/tau [Candidatus Limiplasma sp.]|nr:DNA polymerase III subunit gamma/tau [Candidatus Limiplasma sp.]HRX08422.1 DNA polymerase III subunit gamma/tau [Candidatus Limiplasma sp.]